MMKNPINYLHSHGLHVYLKGGKPVIHGMDTILPDDRAELLEYAKLHKPEIIETLNRTTPRCLGIVCDHSECREIGGMPYCLWCRRAEGLVLDLMECPEGYWTKDLAGFPVPDQLK